MNNPLPLIKQAVDSVAAEHVADCECSVCAASQEHGDFIDLLPEAESKQRAS